MIFLPSSALVNGTLYISWLPPSGFCWCLHSLSVEYTWPQLSTTPVAHLNQKKSSRYPRTHATTRQTCHPRWVWRMSLALSGTSTPQSSPALSLLRYGRWRVVLVMQLVTSTIVISLCFIHSFTFIVVARFVLGTVNLPTLFILALEVCEPKNRGLVGIVMGLPWALGTMLWGALAYCIREWRWLQAAVSFPILLTLIPTYFIDESPRWLIVNGHYDKALKVLEKASRWNKVSLPPEEDLRALMRNIQEESATAATAKESVQEGSEKFFKKLSRFLSLPGLLSNRVITVVTVIVCLDYFTASLVFDGLNLSGDNYSADPFLYIVLGGLMEVPGYTITGPIIDRWGRRVPTALSFIICSILLLTLTFIPSGLSWLVVTLALAGKVCISGAFQLIYVYGSELFPTEVRLQGLGAASVSAQLASVILPYITTYLGPLVPWAPSVIFSSMSLMAGVTSMVLHETAGEVLPDTITDLKNIGSRRNQEKNAESTEIEQTRF
ncbi:organic cation transporter protein isoform X2 [Cherax quadricarinatus]|uniref:organic cation transporter protein isoform X2 n=1 Tax=Cherax quadricarinatus TaxID=27406 RepID=UPI00387E9469